MACGCGNGSGSNEINTVTCDGDVPCTPCSNTVLSPCNTIPNCTCGQSPCQCNPTQVATPTPFYNCGTAVQETHCKTIVQSQYVTAVTTSTTFNMPACNFTAVITIPGLTKIQVGAYLWNSTYGYLEVVSFDFASGQITVKNNCESGNASPGTNIPACTLFNVVDPPGISGGSTQTGVFVASDFVAPAVGDCISIQVTGVAGLTVGASVQISSGIYRLAAIVSPTIITICNDGAGVTAGTIVVAKDASGTYITPVTPLNVNACTNTPNATGSIITCHNGVQAPLEATGLGQIPVVVDATTNEVEFQNVNIPIEECAIITSCLNLFDGVTSYNVVVDDTAIFAVNDVVIIHDPAYEDARWIVTAVTPPDVITINKTTPQVGNDQIGCNNTLICLAPCCEQIAAGNLCDFDWSPAVKVALEDQLAVNTGIVALGEFLTGDATFVIINNTTCTFMVVTVSVDYYVINAFVTAQQYAQARMQFQPWYAAAQAPIAAPPVPVPVQIYDVFNDISLAGLPLGSAGTCETTGIYYSDSFHYCQQYILLSGNALRVDAYGKVRCAEYAQDDFCAEPIVDGGTLTVGTLETHIHLMGVALPQ